ncbi:MAG: hypothetical protein KBA61_18405, partial [Spirochaetes bacterium]|nr:hypothetical protein [Spirochaetota bacterium]
VLPVERREWDGFFPSVSPFILLLHYFYTSYTKHPIGPALSRGRTGEYHYPFDKKLFHGGEKIQRYGRPGRTTDGSHIFYITFGIRP